MKMKLHFLRICSLILSCMMVCNLCNATAFAEETSDSISVEASQVQSFLPDNDSSFQDGPDEGHICETSPDETLVPEEENIQSSSLEDPFPKSTEDTYDSAKIVSIQDIEDNGSILQAIEDILSFVENRTEWFELTNVDFEAVNIGSVIPIYETCDGELIPSDTFLIPVLANNEIKNTFFVSQYGDDWDIQLDGRYVNQINTLPSGSSFAIVNDCNGAYLISEDSHSLLEQFEDNCQLALSDSELEETARTPISAFAETDFASLLSSPPVVELELNVHSEISSQAFDPDNYEVFCDVLPVKQPSGSHFCWACCIASMVDYMYGGNIGYEQVAYLFNGYVDEDMTMDDIIYNFNRNFSANYTYANGNSMSTSFLMGHLRNGRPMIGGYSYAGYGHALVICGVSSNAYAVMDPATGGYAAGTIYASSSGWSYRSDGKRYTLACYGYYAG